MKDKREVTIKDLAKSIDDLAVMTVNGFNDMRKQVNTLSFDQKEFRTEFNERVSKLEDSDVWIKNILESHTKMLKDLGEEKTFIVHRTDRIEADVDLIKKQLKAA